MPPKKGQKYRSKPGTRIGHVYRTLEERIEAKIERLESGCWKWTGGKIPAGYGHIWGGPEQRRLILAHRATYELYRGAIPEGLTLDHLCRNRWCVNPDHLEPVTMKENSYRGHNPSMLAHLAGACMRGHAMTPENTYHDHVHPGRTICKTCVHAARERRRAANDRGEA